MAQPGVGVAALTDRLCGHAKRVHGVCGSSVLKGCFLTVESNQLDGIVERISEVGGAGLEARPRGKRQIREGVLQETVSAVW